MPVTVVRCSHSGCRSEASRKIAAPWKDGSFSELKTYGYACPDHSDAVLGYAQKRPKPGYFSPGETIGAIGVYELAE